MEDLQNITLKELMDLVEKKDSAKLQEILTKFKSRWNELMEENKKQNQKLHLTNIILHKQNLSGIDLSDAVIEDSDFSGSDMSDADLSGADIKRVNLTYVILDKANMYQARISQTDMTKAHMYDVHMLNTSLTGSVNVFDAYTGEFEYSTSHEVTKRGFRKIENEYADGDDDKETY
ncbi:MAG: pentapeptide repeat-containing protein [archaeon]